MPYILKKFKLNLLRLKRALETLKSFKWYFLHLKCALHSQRNLSILKPLKSCAIESEHLQRNPQISKTIKSYALKSKHLQTSQLSLSTLKNLKSHALASNIRSNKKQKQRKYLQQTNVPSDTSSTLKLQSANPSKFTPQPQSNQISRYFTCMMDP